MELWTEYKNYMSFKGPYQVTNVKESAHFIFCAPQQSDLEWILTISEHFVGLRRTVWHITSSSSPVGGDLITLPPRAEEHFLNSIHVITHHLWRQLVHRWNEQNMHFVNSVCVNKKLVKMAWQLNCLEHRSNMPGFRIWPPFRIHTRVNQWLHKQVEQ